MDGKNTLGTNCVHWKLVFLVRWDENNIPQVKHNSVKVLCYGYVSQDLELWTLPRWKRIIKVNICEPFSENLKLSEAKTGPGCCVFDPLGLTKNHFRETKSNVTGLPSQSTEEKLCLFFIEGPDNYVLNCSLVRHGHCMDHVWRTFTQHWRGGLEALLRFLCKCGLFWLLLTSGVNSKPIAALEILVHISSTLIAAVRFSGLKGMEIVNQNWDCI